MLTFEQYRFNLPIFVQKQILHMTDLLAGLHINNRQSDDVSRFSQGGAS
jgi:hypothetical protein